MSWLLARPDLGLVLVVPREVPDVQVRFAHAIELEDPSPWLSGGELVLTTGLRMSRTRAEQVAYVERLAAVEVAALAFGVGVRFDTIPTMIRETCERVGLPLVQVPLPTPFIALAQAVSDRLAEQHNERNQRAVRFQEDMTRAALHDGTRGLVEVLARELACTAMVIDNHLMLLEQSATAPGTLDRIQREISVVADRPGPTSLSVLGDHGALQIHRLGGKSASRGWLAVATAGPLSAADRMLLIQAASMITLQLERPRELAEAHRRLGTTVLELLFDSDESEPDPTLVEHLVHFGFVPGELVRVLLIVPERNEDLPLELILERLAAGPWPHVVTPTKDGVVALVRSDDAGGVVDEVLRALQHAQLHGVRVGVSGPVRQRSVNAARAAARQAASSARWRRESVGWYERLSLEAILADSAVRSRIRMLSESPLGSLLDEGSAQHRTLARSLEAFLRHNGSWETASRALGIHRHTLRSHMAKVEKLTGSRLDVAEDRMALLLALIARSC